MHHHQFLNLLFNESKPIASATTEVDPTSVLSLMNLALSSEEYLEQVRELMSIMPSVNYNVLTSTMAYMAVSRSDMMPTTAAFVAELQLNSRSSAPVAPKPTKPTWAMFSKLRPLVRKTNSEEVFL